MPAGCVGARAGDIESHTDESADAEANSDTNADAGTNADTNAVTNAVTNADSDSDTDADADADTNADTDAALCGVPDYRYCTTMFGDLPELQWRNESERGQRAIFIFVEWREVWRFPVYVVSN